PKTGSFSLIVVDIDPIYTLGKIAQNRQRIIEELRISGLLEKNKSLKIPVIPLKIGLITSFSSAAYHDFANELKGSGYGFKIFLCDCYMQGKFVEKDVLRALRLFNNLPMNKTPPSKVSGGSTCARKGIPMDKLDVVVITRGGGSTADLSYFDNKRVAEAVANSKFPVISALGHQINITIVDMAAHTTLKTPTKAAQFLVELVGEFVEGLNYLEQQIVRKTEDLFKIKKGGLETMAVKMDSILSHYFRFHEQQLLEKKLTMLNSLKAILVKKRQKLERIFEGCKAASSRIFKSSQDYIEYIKEKIKLLDPGNILRRGYSITFKDKKVLKSVDDLMEKDYIRTILHKGSIISEVKRKEGGND
ncbi:MAG: exodeoxyribonuclease VII large subunit, partial [Candidatus Omnitrophica bacterium]|nr:exodeoxyribonuclease VII large subunit [Candidatus Omnitrophota bacterium]MBU1523526.1 exodeoxyribonuclease VII large subunit [Candidatus Omnitrophota bacterium]